MTRLEELTLNLADETLTDDESLELEALLAESEGRERHIRLLEIEAGLRGHRQRLDLTYLVMARVHGALAESMARNVMTEIRAQPMPAWLPSRSSRLQEAPPRSWAEEFQKLLTSAATARRKKPAVLAFVAFVILFAGLGFWCFGPTVGEPVLAEVQGGGLALERAGQTVPALAGTQLQPGDRLLTAENVKATITYASETTQIIIGPNTDLSLATVSRGKRFSLRTGELSASVAHQRPFRPMLITSPQAEARVLGTRLSLLVNSNQTHLEVNEGKVRFTRRSDGLAVDVTAGHYAVAAPGYHLLAQPLTGSILREYWTNLPGEYFVTLLTWNPAFPDHPSGREYLPKFEAPSHWGKNYGARIRGFLHPPVTGDYTFWIAAGDGAELWLSPDDRPENRIGIGNAEHSGPHEWTKLRKQQSSAIRLVAGRKYYIEALQKQGATRDDHLAVAWQGPEREREIIPGQFLSPFTPKPKEIKP